MTKPAKRNQLPKYLTYLIAEKYVASETLRAAHLTEEDRNFGLGKRNPATLPGVRSDSESEWANHHSSKGWSALRKWVASANSSGVKY